MSAVLIDLAPPAAIRVNSATTFETSSALPLTRTPLPAFTISTPTPLGCLPAPCHLTHTDSDLELPAATVLVVLLAARRAAGSTADTADRVYLQVLLTRAFE